MTINNNLSAILILFLCVQKLNAHILESWQQRKKNNYESCWGQKPYVLQGSMMPHRRSLLDFWLGGSKTFRCVSAACDAQLDRDDNGARNIWLRNVASRCANTA